MRCRPGGAPAGVRFGAPEGLDSRPTGRTATQHAGFSSHANVDQAAAGQLRPHCRPVRIRRLSVRYSRAARIGAPLARVLVPRAGSPLSGPDSRGARAPARQEGGLLVQRSHPATIRPLSGHSSRPVRIGRMGSRLGRGWERGRGRGLHVVQPTAKEPRLVRSCLHPVIQAAKEGRLVRGWLHGVQPTRAPVKRGELPDRLLELGDEVLGSLHHPAGRQPQ